MNKLFVLFLSIFLILPSFNSFAEEKVEYYEQVYLTEKQALDMVFKDLKVEKKQITATKDKKNIIQKRLKRKIKEDTFTYYFAQKSNNENIYAWILDEHGKHRPITFIVSINNKITVEQVAIMIYREKRGAEVQKKRFLNQFNNKSSQDEIKVNQDIINITGATISSWSVSAGVKKALVLTEELIIKK